MKYLVIIYALVLIIGTAYLVFYKGINEWWWVLTLILLDGVKYSESNKKEE